MKDFKIHPIAAAGIVAAAVSLGGIAVLHIDPPKQQVSMTFQGADLDELLDRIGEVQALPGMTSTTTGTRPSHVTMTPAQRERELTEKLIDARCHAAGGDTVGNTPTTRCSVDLPALPEIKRER